MLLLWLAASLRLGVWEDDGFFWEQAVFPLALRHPSCPIGWWGAGELTRGRGGSARVGEEADDGITGGDGMAEPRCQVYHPNHSNSHVVICQFLPFFSNFCPQP
jgi:hypothetical protein